MSVKDYKISEIPAPDLFGLVHRKNETVDYKSSETLFYESRYARFKNQELFISWNWAAALLTSFWLWYRKMYAYFFIFITISLLIDLPVGYFIETSSHKIWYLFLASLFELGLSIVLCGLFGNALYFHFLRKKYDANVRQLGTNGKFVSFIIVLALVLAYGFGYIVFTKILHS